MRMQATAEARDLPDERVLAWEWAHPADMMRRVLNGTERGLVGYWRMNEGPGAMIFDFSSYANVGPIKGEPAWTAHIVPLQEQPGQG